MGHSPAARQGNTPLPHGMGASPHRSTRRPVVGQEATPVVRGREATSAYPMDRESWIARTLVALSDTVKTDFDLQTQATVLVERCAELVGTPDVGMLLTDEPGQLRVAQTTTERMRVLLAAELEVGEGPALGCLDNGRPALNLQGDRLDGPWARFGPLARAMGFQTVHVLPLRLRSETIGALMLCDGTDRVLTGTVSELCQAMADSTTIGIVHERSIRKYTELSQQLQSALDSRVLIEQAKGVLAERLTLSMDEAFELLRRFARTRNMNLASVARAAIDGQLMPSELQRAPSRSGGAGRGPQPSRA
jgi:transcriptional regulator with GAF, ATPase, and Fis domain